MAPSWLENLGRGILPVAVPPFGLLQFLVLPVPLFFLRRRGKSAGYLLSFSLFFLYAWALVAYTLFYTLPTNAAELEVIQRSRWSASIHLIPAFLSGTFDPRSEQVYGNFLLGVPFGFGLLLRRQCRPLALERGKQLLLLAAQLGPGHARRRAGGRFGRLGRQ